MIPEDLHEALSSLLDEELIIRLDAASAESLTAAREMNNFISVLEFKTTEYGRSKKVVASEEVKKGIQAIGINKCARESGFDRKNFIRKLVRALATKLRVYKSNKNP